MHGLGRFQVVWTLIPPGHPARLASHCLTRQSLRPRAPSAGTPTGHVCAGARDSEERGQVSQ